MDRFYLNSLEEEDFEESINAYFKKKETNPKLQLVLLTQQDDLESDDYLKNVLQTANVLQSRGIEPHDIIVAVGEEGNNQYSQNQFARIKAIRGKLQSKGLAFGFEDYNYVWSVEEVENANAKIDKSADSLRGKNYSPLEKLLSAYIDVTRNKYKMQDVTEHFSQSRSIYGVLNSDKIVCVGYASLLQAIIERNGDKNIKLYANNVACSNDGEHITGYHRNLIVYIQDPKYGIDGYYYLDPTWDSVTKGKTGINLNYFLVPLQDIQKLKTNILDKNSSLPQKLKSSNPKRLSAKTKKAIAKNTGKTYNRLSLQTLSFSSEKFSMSSNFRYHLSENPKYLKARGLAKANHPISDDVVEAVELKYSQMLEAMEQIKQLFKQNNVTKLPIECLDKFSSIIKEDGTIADCMDYAKDIMSNITTSESVNDAYWDRMLQRIQKVMGADVALEKISQQKDTSTPSDMQKWEIELQSRLDNSRKVVECFKQLYAQNPTETLEFLNNIAVNEFATGMNMFDLDLILLEEINQTTIQECMKGSLDLQADMEIDMVFVTANWAINRKLSQQQQEVKTKLIAEEQKITYEAMCSTSEPIPVAKFSRALTNVLSKRCPTISQSEVIADVNKIMRKNSLSALTRYNAGAVNSFYIEGDYYQQQSQIK